MVGLWYLSPNVQEESLFLDYQGQYQAPLCPSKTGNIDPDCPSGVNIELNRSTQLNNYVLSVSNYDDTTKQLIIIYN